MPSHDLSKRKSIFHFTVSKVKGDRGSQNCLDRNNQKYNKVCPIFKNPRILRYLVQRKTPLPSGERRGLMI